MHYEYKMKYLSFQFPFLLSLALFYVAPYSVPHRSSARFSYLFDFLVLLLSCIWIWMCILFPESILNLYLLMFVGLSGIFPRNIIFFDIWILLLPRWKTVFVDTYPEKYHEECNRMAHKYTYCMFMRTGTTEERRKRDRLKIFVWFL